MRLLVEYTSHGRGPAAPQTYSTTLDIVDDVAERLLKAKTPRTRSGSGSAAHGKL